MPPKMIQVDPLAVVEELKGMVAEQAVQLALARARISQLEQAEAEREAASNDD